MQQISTKKNINKFYVRYLCQVCGGFIENIFCLLGELRKKWHMHKVLLYVVILRALKDRYGCCAGRVLVVFFCEIIVLECGII